MALAHKTDVYQSPEGYPGEKAVRKHRGYGFLVAVVGAALAIVIAAAIVRPLPVGSGLGSEAWYVGP